MVSIAKLTGRKAIALLSDMNQPLGNAVGNTLELVEAIQTLHGKGPADFREHCLTVASVMLTLGGISVDEDQGRLMADESIDHCRAWEKFRALVAAQGGDVTYIDNPELLPRARLIDQIPAQRSGYLAGIHARLIGEASVLLGAGRNKKGDTIDHAVGVLIHHKVGDWVEEGQPLFTIHANDEGRLAEARRILIEAHTWSNVEVERLPLFYDVIRD
jgi:pyrimidine-nucleoside phosphorylase